MVNLEYFRHIQNPRRDLGIEVCIFLFYYF